MRFYDLRYQLKNRRTDIFTICHLQHNRCHFAYLYNQFNHIFTLLMSMPHFKNINFYQNRPKIILILKKKIQSFRLLGVLPPDSRNSHPPLQVSGYAAESNHVFALLISMPPKSSLMPCLKSINSYQNKPNIKLFLQKKIKFLESWRLCRQTP